jgi:hypothetical protein
MLLRYDGRLPEGDSDDVRIVLHHMGRCGDDAMTMRAWIKAHASWLDDDDADWIIRTAVESEKSVPRADTLARFLDLTAAVRHALGITTIGAVDQPKRQRTKAHKVRKRIAGTIRARAKRLAAGARPHAESLSRTRPWEAAGISRRTWYRHRGTDSSDSNVAKPHAGSRTCATERAEPPERGGRASSDRPCPAPSKAPSERDRIRVLPTIPSFAACVATSAWCPSQGATIGLQDDNSNYRRIA